MIVAGFFIRRKAESGESIACYLAVYDCFLTVDILLYLNAAYLRLLQNES